MPQPGQSVEADIDRSAADDINKKPLSNLPETKAIVPLTPTGRPVDPDANSIDRNPMSSLPEA